MQRGDSLSNIYQSLWAGVARETSILHGEGYLAHLGAFNLILTHLN